MEAATPPRATGASTPPSEEAADRRVRRGRGLVESWCAFPTAQLPQESSKVTWEPACKPGACPVRSVSWDVRPLQPITSLKHQPREHTRPVLVDEVTGQCESGGGGVDEVTRCQPGLPFPQPKLPHVVAANLWAVSRDRETLTGKLHWPKLH